MASSVSTAPPDAEPPDAEPVPGARRPHAAHEPPRPHEPGLRGLMVLGVLGVIVATVAQVTGAVAGGRAGNALGRLDVGYPLLVCAAAALAYVPVARRAISGDLPTAPRSLWRRPLLTLLPAWWLVSTVALYLYAPHGSSAIPVDRAMPHVGDVLRTWTLTGPFFPSSFPHRLPQTWVVTLAVLGWLLLPAWERLLGRPRRVEAQARLRVHVTAGLSLLAVGLAWRVFAGVLPTSSRWLQPARAIPLAHLDVVGIGVIVCCLAVWARHRLALTDPGRAVPGPHLGLGAVGLAAAAFGALALWSAGNGEPGLVRDLATRLLQIAVVAPLIGVALLGGTTTSISVNRALARVDRRCRPFAFGAFLWFPLALQIWAMRNGGDYRSLRLGTTLAFTLGLSATLGWLTQLLVRRLRAAPRRPSPFRTWLSLITLAGLAWRLLTLVSINRRNPDGGDPFFYHQQANMLVSGLGFGEPFRWVKAGILVPSAIHPPLFSLWLAVSSSLGAKTYLAHKAFAALLGAAAVAVVGLIGRRVGGTRAGLIAAALAAAYPNLWVIDGVLWPEGAYTLMVALALLALYRWIERPSVAAAALVGTGVGLAALTRGEALLLLPLTIVPAMALCKGRWRTWALSAGLAVVVAGVLLVPWTVRNRLVFHQNVALSTNSDEVLYYANCPDVYDGPSLGYWSFNCQQRVRAEKGEPPGNEAQKAKYWRHLGIQYLKDHTDRLTAVIPARVGREWDVFRTGQAIRFLEIEGRPVAVSRAGLYSYWLLAPLGLAGLVLIRRRRRTAVWPLASQFVLVTITAIYAYGAVRFRTPAELALLVGAGVSIDTLASKVQGRRGPADDALERHHPPPAAVAHTSEDISLRAALRRGGQHLMSAVRWLTSGRRGTWLAAGVVGVAVVLPLRTLFRFQGPPMEEGFMLSFPEQVLRGNVPNRDFLHLYGPGSLWALAGWFKAFGTTLAAERTFGLLQLAGIIFAMFGLARPWGKRVAVATGLVGVLVVMTTIGLTALAWDGGVALGLAGLATGMRGRRLLAGSRSALLDDADPSEADVDRGERWLLAAGVLGGLALTFRPDLLIAIVLAFGILAWPWADGRREVRPVATGLGLGVSPYLVLLLTAGPGHAFSGMFLDPVLRLRDGRHLPIPPSWSKLDGALQAVAQLRVPHWPVPAFTASQQVVVWFALLPVVTLFGLATGVMAVRRDPKAMRPRVLLMVSAFGLGILPQALQRPDTTHLAWVSCVPLVYLPAVLAEWGRRLFPRRPGRAAAAGGVVALVLVGALLPYYTLRTYTDLVQQDLSGKYFGYPIRNGDRLFYVGSQPIAAAAQRMVDDLQPRIRPGQRLLVGTADLRKTPYSDAYLYFLLPKAEVGTYYIEMDPGIANGPSSKLPGEIARSDWLILSLIWDVWSEPNASRRLGPDKPNQVVRRLYCFDRVYGPGDGYFQVWRKRQQGEVCPNAPPAILSPGRR